MAFVSAGTSSPALEWWVSRADSVCFATRADGLCRRLPDSWYRSEPCILP